MGSTGRLAVLAGLGSAALSLLIMNTPAPQHPPVTAGQPPAPPPKKKERVYH